MQTFWLNTLQKDLVSKPLRMSVAVTTLIKVFIPIVFFNSITVMASKHRHQSRQESSQIVCYPRLGCFKSLPPFSPTMPLPMSPQKIQTKYYLRTRRNLQVDQPIEPERKNLTASLFDPKKPTKIIIHGFAMTKRVHLPSWIPESTESILFHEDVNVIQINWLKGAAVKYDNAASNTRVVGAQVGLLINMLMEVHDAQAEDFHLIGFSLGAHVAGFAGKKVQKGGKKSVVGRITGLDPANPAFNYDDPAVRLDKTDAKFVDVIHTDTSTLSVMAVGLNRNLGHIDFYPNGGAEQTGCHSRSKSSSWIPSIAGSTACDHLRATELFKHSINATGDFPHMVGYKCDSFDRFKRGVCLRCKGSNRCRRMGYWAKPLRHSKKQLQYYLSTSGESPYTANHYQVQIRWRKSSSAAEGGFKTKLFITLHGDHGSTEEIALNDGLTFHAYAGRTNRFLVTQNTNNDIGNLERVSFRWQRTTCWSWFFCSNENVRLKRIKVLDASTQKKAVFLSIGRHENDRIRSYFVKPGEHFELLRSSYIRTMHPRRYKSLNKEEALLKQSYKNLIRPTLAPTHDENLMSHTPKSKNRDTDRGSLLAKMLHRRR